MTIELNSNSFQPNGLERPRRKNRPEHSGRWEELLGEHESESRSSHSITVLVNHEYEQNGPSVGW